MIYEFVVENVWAKRVMHTNGKVSISSTARILYPANIHVGHKTNINRYCCLWASPNARISIGENCLTGPNVTILTSKYSIRGIDNFRKNVPIEKDVVIEDDVWLGANVVVLPGVRIGKGSVVGAGTVITKSVPAFSIVISRQEQVVKIRE
jgi:acetyltransferase-like isoleucine patch superfamily enzyme